MFPVSKTKLAIGTGLFAGGLWVLMSVDLRELLSTLADRTCDQPECATDVVRDAFSSTCVPEPSPVLGHTHPDAAAYRSSATMFARNLAASIGARLYSVQMSKADQRRGIKGSRSWHWAKDTNVSPGSDNPNPSDVLYICDTDYYMRMDRLLRNHFKPVVLYTAVPDTAASTVDNTSISFNEKGELVTLVSGGGKYVHRLWDYGHDSLLITKYFLGIPYEYKTYAVERKQVTTNRQVILIAPLKRFSGMSALFASFILNGPPLTRFNPIQIAPDGQKFVRLTVKTINSLLVSTGRPDSMLCATIDSSLDQAIATVARLGTTNLMLPTVASWLGKESRESAALLTEYHRACTSWKGPTTFPLEKSVRAYSYDTRKVLVEARPKLQAFMCPIVHGAFAPSVNKEAEERCVEGRITSLRKPEPRSHTFREQCVAEFAELVSAGMTLEPVCYETVDNKQTSATQKLSLRKAVVAGPMIKRVLKCFLKSEAYGDVKDPRNISTYNDLDKLSMATYALALSEHCKKFPWYGPGKTPKEIAQRVVEICTQPVNGLPVEFVNVSDFHRMDGTVSYTLRSVERAVVMRMFPNHRTVLNELLKRNVDNHGTLPLGTTFNQGPSHGSGCSATSLFQTLRAAFTSYLAYRHQRDASGRGFSMENAFDSLGIHLGDDGLDANLQTDSHEWAARLVGLELEANTVARGAAGVNFLARYYSQQVWTGSPDSMCDIRRQLSKFHTTVRLPDNVKPEHKLVEKSMAYVASDGNTPVIGPLCKKVLLLSSFRPTTPLGVANWWSRFEASQQYPNANIGGWMDVEFSRQFEEFDHCIFDNWLSCATTVEELLAPPLCAEPKPATPTTVDVIVDEQMVRARSDPAETQSNPETKTKEKREQRRTRKMSSSSLPPLSAKRSTPPAKRRVPYRKSAGSTKH